VGAGVEFAFSLSAPGEAWAALTLAAPGTSWWRPDAAAVALDVDGRARQEIILAGGEEPTEYLRLLGRLSSGAHRIRLRVHGGLTAFPARGVVAHQLRAGVVADSDPVAPVWRHAPVIHYRALDGRLDSLATDTPLLLFYRMSGGGQHTVVEYHVIYSHEDAGTDLTGLLARWGHAVDIEWVFRVTLNRSGKVCDEEFQGPAHGAVRFAGRRTMGDHPVLQVATRNGMVTDRVGCRYRAALAPACRQPAGEPREGVLHRFPWIYRVSAGEVHRQTPLEKVADPATPVPADSRAYLYLHCRRSADAATLPFEAAVRVAGAWYTSAWGRRDLAPDEPDAESTAVKLPAGTTEAGISAIALRAMEPPRHPAEVALVRAFLLDDRYRPRAPLPARGTVRFTAKERDRTVWERRTGVAPSSSVARLRL
jgi:hypothetical protein